MGDTITQTLNPLSIAQQVAGPAVSLYNNERNISAQNRANDLNMQENQRNRDFNAQEAEKQRSFEAQQAQLANQFNADEALKSFQRSSQFQKEMWQKQNEYDSPKAQVQRLVEAGLNPNLFGGDNTSGAFGAASAPSASANMPHGSAATHGSSLPVAPPTYTNPLLEAAQIRNLNSQSDKLNSDTDLNKANKQRLQELLSGEKEIQRLQILSHEFDLEKLKPQQVDNLIAQTNNLNKNSESLDAQIAKFQQEVKNLLAQENLTWEQVSRAKIENESLPEYLQSEIARNFSEVFKNREEANFYAQQATNAILTGGHIALQFLEDEKTHGQKIEITSSENDWTILKNHWRANYPRLHYALELGNNILSGMARGMTSAVGKVVGVVGAAAASPK